MNRGVVWSQVSCALLSELKVPEGHLTGASGSLNPSRGGFTGLAVKA